MGPPTGTVADQSFTGPATYTQTLTVAGLDGVVSGLFVTIVNGPAGVHAWHALFPGLPPVPPPLPDCEDLTGFDTLPSVAGAMPIPGAMTAVRVSSSDVSITTPVQVSTITIHVTISPPLVAYADFRYAIATLRYHHEDSVAGYQPGSCDGADQPHCFVANAQAIVGGSFMSLPIENPALSWQGGSISGDQCLRLATPATRATWGSLKTLHR